MNLLNRLSLFVRSVSKIKNIGKKRPAEEFISIRPDDPVICYKCGSKMKRVEIDESTDHFVCPIHGVRWTFKWVDNNKNKEITNDDIQK